jgi:hypothetical protein
MNWNQRHKPAIPACWPPIMAENRTTGERQSQKTTQKNAASRRKRRLIDHDT